MDPNPLYDRKLVDEIAGGFCHRYGLLNDECADFSQDVHLRLIEDDYARLRQFQGKCSLKTFLHVTIKRMAIDHLIKKRGKWRPSPAARRLGPAAVELEILMYRENHPRDAAIQIMVSKNTHGLSENDLRKIVLRLPLRTFGRVESNVETEELPDPDGAERQVLESEQEERMAAAREKLSRAMEKLDAEDRLIVRMKYWDGFTAVRIKKILGIESRIHDRIARILQQLRSLLNDDGPGGLHVDDIRDLFPD